MAISTELPVRLVVIISSIIWGIWEKRCAERNRGNVEGEEVKGCRIAIEERVLMDHFGQKYKEYCDTTSRLLPGIW
jgi:protein-S-isoprenylcysteine O-methyltransferase Ste14